MPLGREVGLGLGHISLVGDAAPHPEGGTAAPFRPMSIVAKRSPVSANAELLFNLTILKNIHLQASEQSAALHLCELVNFVMFVGFPFLFQSVSIFI